MSVNNEYEDDFYETSDFDLINFDEEFDEATGPKLNTQPNGSSRVSKKKPGKKKRRLEDWLEEKRLRDELQDDNLDP